MPRVKRGTISLKRRRNILKQVKGYRFGRSTKERQAREEKERLEREAIQKIRDGINDFQSAWTDKIHECKTEKTLDKYLKEVKATKVTKKEYGEQVELMKQAITILVSQIEQRREVVKKLAEAEDNVDKEEILAEANQEQTEAHQELSLEQQQAEMIAEQELLTALSSIKTKDSLWEVDVKMRDITEFYGSAVIAIKNRDKIITHIQKKDAEAQSLRELSDGKVKNQRKELKFEIVDPNKVPRAFLKVDEAAIKAAISEHRDELKESIDAFTIDGVRIYIDVQTVLGA